MKKMKKIESNEINSIFSNREIGINELANILGGVAIHVTCSNGESLKGSTYAEKCNGSSTTLHLHCSNGGSLTEKNGFYNPLFPLESYTIAEDLT